MQQHIKMFNSKLIKSGNLLEAIRYENTQYLFQHPKISQHRLSGCNTNSSSNHERHLKTNLNRARSKLRRLIACNFEESYTFLTLTFKEDIRDLQIADKHLRSFKKAIQRYMGKENQQFKYIYTTEFQENRGGTIHYHMICNLRYMPIADIQHYWKYGTVDIEYIDDISISSYKQSRYMLKLGYDKRLTGRNLYSISRNLEHPTTVYFEDELKMFQEISDAKCINSYEYSNEYTGRAKYEEYIKNQG